MIGIGLITILNSDDSNVITVSEKNIANAQLEDSTSSQNIVDLKVSERITTLCGHLLMVKSIQHLI